MYVITSLVCEDLCVTNDVLGVFKSKLGARKKLANLLVQDMKDCPEKWEDELAFSREVSTDYFKIWKADDYLSDNYEVAIKCVDVE